MTFTETIIANSADPLAKLYNAALKTKKQPETGITVQNPVALKVIQDSAAITVDYLPLRIWASYGNPFETLKGKFTSTEISNFCSQASSEFAKRQLAELIAADIRDKKILESKLAPVTASTATQDDPYMDYADAEPGIAATNNYSLADILKIAFEAK